MPASMPFESRMRERNMSIHSARDTLEASGNNADHAVKFARLAAAYAIEMGKGSTRAVHAEAQLAQPAPTNSCNWTWALLAALATAGILLERRVTR